ncbi:hypothetical protein KAJ89_04755, partial [Candidatus Parcubacteria bacterium]|nr:hypothetical protein [Candidatus Parcubacteria bacterium]
MTKKISENNILIITIILFGVFCIFDYVSAIDIINIGKNAVLTVIAVGASLFTFIAGIIIMIVIWAITHIAEYNNFINEPPIIGAWIIVRDLCNMFFILILLLIAFSTILRFEGYSIKKLLPKLVMMAVLINFSRMICGIIIDAGQIVMLTFISAIGNSGGNYIEHLGVQNYLNQTFTNDWSRDIDFFSVAGGMVLGAVFLVIAITVFIILLAMLAMRVVMLWIYIVLSPIAFLLSAFPGGQKYARQWWGDFAKQVVIGPLLAFFIWLSLVSANQVGNLGDIANTSCFGPQDIVCPANFINFVVAIGTLIAGMSVASSMGGVVGSTVQKLKAKDSIANLHRTGLKALGNYGIDKTHEKSGIDLNVGRVWKGIQTKRAEKQSERYSSGQQKAAEVMATRGRAWGALAMTGTPATAWEQITSKKGLRQRFTGGKRMAKKKDEFQDILDNKKFESDFVGANAEKRVEMRDNLLKEYPSIQNEIKA